jgi:cellulose synthase/poly-beta-1,6-N-acetylglucosamine synthase-like glycosyltransferase
MSVKKVADRAYDNSEIQPALICSVGVMAYNEEANIGRCLQGLIDQETCNCSIKEIIVVASGCTDNTVPIVQEFCAQNEKIRLLVQEEREGKASAINLFLSDIDSEIVILESADTVPDSKTIERLIEPFAYPEIGMTGGHPIPVNDPNTFMGFIVHTLWELHHQIALQQPKLGELTAFRRVFHRIPFDSAVDEANIEPLIVGQGYELQYVPEAIVYNRGPETISDFIRQRRRIYAGHLGIRRKQGYSVSTMSSIRILKVLLRNWRWEWRYIFFTPAVIGLEAYGRFLAWIDFRFKKRDHSIWDIAVTTKGAIVD